MFMKSSYTGTLPHITLTTRKNPKRHILEYWLRKRRLDALFQTSQAAV